jgi:AraC-like DNA-binding protein
MVGVPTVATTSSRALLAACDRLGLDGAKMLEDAGLTRAEVDDPENRLEVGAVTRLWQSALTRSADLELGLRVAVAVPFGAYRVIDFLAASAATVGEGLLRVARYFPLVNSALAWDVVEEPERVRMTLAHPTIPALPRPYAEYALVVTILHCRHASGFDWPLEEVTFAFEPPSSAAEHVKALGCGVRFGQPQSSFVLARSTWDRPAQAASSELLRTLEEHADRLIATLRAEHVVSAQIARFITEELQGGDASLAKIARRVAMSPRTLQRRLEMEGTSYAEVLDQTRRHCAQLYVKEPNLAITEIAYLLGFSEPSAFSRAFQRWYGVPPSQFRQNQAV